jgi:nicotinamidase-related amidase
MAWTKLPDVTRITMETPRPLPLTLKSDQTALVVVDMQEWIRDDPASRYYAAIEGNLRLVEAARAAGVPVFFTQNLRRPDDLEFTVFGREPYLLEGTPGTQILAELAPREHEPVVRKHTIDPFAGTELSRLFLERRLLPTETTVLVTGVSALVSAYSACVGFKCRNYLTVIPMDCQAAGTVEDEARAYLKYVNTNRYAFTLSDMVEFSPAGMATRDIVDVITVAGASPY